MTESKTPDDDCNYQVGTGRDFKEKYGFTAENQFTLLAPHDGKIYQ